LTFRIAVCPYYPTRLSVGANAQRDPRVSVEMGEGTLGEDASGSVSQLGHALVGRGGECAAIDELIADARRGSGRFFCFEGEAGIGKTALLGWATAAATDFRVLRSRPSPDIDGLAYSAVSELLSPLHERGEALSAPNSAVLNQLFAREVAPDATPSSVVDPLTLGAALLDLFEELSQDRPLLVLIDDAHWLDASSTLALAFVARRLDGLPVAMMVATRPEGAPTWHRDQLDGVRVSGLSAEASVELLEGRAAPAVALQLAETTSGNPLALLGICEVLTDDQRWERAPLQDLSDIDAPHRWFGGRLAQLGPDARLAVSIVAHDDRLDRSVVVAVCERLGAHDGEPSVAEAEQRGLIRLEPSGLALVHPLLRSEVDLFMEPGIIRAVHRAIAETLRRDADLERRAWHISRSVEGPDEYAAGLLVAAGQSALARGDPNAAALSLLRAAELTELVDERITRFGAAGDAFAIAGQSQQAIATFDRALSETSDLLARGALMLRRMIPLADVGADANLVDEMVEAIAAIEPVDGQLAAALAVYSAASALAGGSLGRAGDLLARARMLAADFDGPTEFAFQLFKGIVTVLRGDAPATPMLLELGATPGIASSPMAVHVAIALYWADALQASEDLINSTIAAGRSSRTPGFYTHPLITRAEVHWRTGRFLAARADASEALRLATEAGRPILVGYATSMLARAEASLGLVDRARELATEAATYGGFVGRLFSQSDAGFIELTADKPADAIPFLERAAEFAAAEGIRPLSPSPWGPDLVEAYVRVGRTGDAEDLVARLVADVGPQPSLWSRGALARCAGLVDDEFDARFADAFDAQGQLPIPFETARTHLCYGERLRRARRPNEAAIELRLAQRMFAELGADRWARRAEREQVSLGRPTEPSRPPALAALTPKEYQVAALIAQGATNRVVAQSLFLSTRTVEAHVARVYKKLGINSRAQLVREFSATEDTQP
jgi:DNA-binding CsgD family transcriptional regulator